MMERGFLLRMAITSVSVFPFGMAPKIASHALLVMRSAMNFHNMQRKRERIRGKIEQQIYRSVSLFLSISQSPCCCFSVSFPVFFFSPQRHDQLVSTADAFVH